MFYPMIAFQPFVSDICAVFCSRVGFVPSCEEEHENWHAYWIESEVTWEEYKAWVTKRLLEGER